MQAECMSRMKTKTILRKIPDGENHIKGRYAIFFFFFAQLLISC